MDAAINYGGWVAPHTGTGDSFSIIRAFGWASAAAVAAFATVGTGSELQLENLQQKVANPHAISAPMLDANAKRSPGEDLARIRQVLSPAVSDLATTLGVTRQSIYNWLNGEPVADENAAKLRDLAEAADVLTYAGVTVNTMLLKRQFANGKTLLQVAQAGESARDAASMLVQILKRESAQRERMNARFAGRAKTPATADFDLPASSDHA